MQNDLMEGLVDARLLKITFKFRIRILYRQYPDGQGGTPTGQKGRRQYTAYGNAKLTGVFRDKALV